MSKKYIYECKNGIYLFWVHIPIMYFLVLSTSRWWDSYKGGKVRDKIIKSDVYIYQKRKLFFGVILFIFWYFLVILIIVGIFLFVYIFSSNNIFLPSCQSFPCWEKKILLRKREEKLGCKLNKGSKNNGENVNIFTSSQTKFTLI